MNIDNELLDVCACRIAQQHTFDKPLGLAVWASVVVDGAHTFLVDKPSGMTEDEAPASAYLQAVV